MVHNLKLEPRKIICVYDAKGSFIGEITYLLKKYFSNYVCAMCDITHNNISKKREWVEKVKKYKYHITTMHIDEQTKNLREFTHNITPCVVGIYDGEKKILMNDEELLSIKGDVNLFFERLNEKI